MRNLTNNIAGLAVIALLVGTSVVAWSRSTGSPADQPPAAQSYEMSPLYSAEQAPFVAP